VEDRSAGMRARSAADHVVSGVAEGMGEQGWRVTVDANECIGSGMCAAAARHRFHLVGGVSRPLAELVEPDETVRGAAETCPVEAITVHDAATAELLAPRPWTG
jgi:ferredoxin